MSTTAGHCVSCSGDGATAGAISGAQAGTAVLPRGDGVRASGSGGAGGCGAAEGDSCAAGGALSAAVAGSGAAGGIVFVGAVAGTVVGGTVAGGTVAAGEVTGGTVAGGTVAGGTVARAELWGGAVAGGTVGALLIAGDAVPGGSVLADSEPEFGDAAGGAAGFHSDGVGPAGRSGSWESESANADGGHAGIVCSVGGSGGQISLWVGSGASGCTFGGQVRGAERAGGDVGLGSGSRAASAGAGEVCAQDGAGFCIGTAGLGSVSSSTAAGSSAGGLVCAHDGAVFIGRAGFASPSRVSWRDSVPIGEGGADSTSGLVSVAGSSALVSTVAWAAGASACNGSSGSVSGSKAGVTRGSSGSVWSRGWGAFSC